MLLTFITIVNKNCNTTLSDSSINYDYAVHSLRIHFEDWSSIVRWLNLVDFNSSNPIRRKTGVEK